MVHARPLLSTRKPHPRLQLLRLGRRQSVDPSILELRERRRRLPLLQCV